MIHKQNYVEGNTKVLVQIAQYSIPYSRKLSRVETFANWMKYIEQFANKTFADCRSYPTHGARTYKILRIKLSRKEAMQRNSRKFSPAKVSRYTIYYTEHAQVNTVHACTVKKGGA